jgi:two-component system OmpR family sensor kinase
VDVAALVADAASDARAQAPDREITTTAPDEALVVSGDEHRLRQVLANLVGNALVHTEEGTPIELSARADEDQVVVTVVDHGAGMSPTVAEHAFERFYRGDPSRTRHHGGSGLGLSIVEAVVTAHGGEATLRDTPGGGTTATVRLPLSAEDPLEDPTAEGDEAEADEDEPVADQAGPTGGRSPRR